MQNIKILAIATLFALAPTLAVADVVVSYYEPLQRTLITKTDNNERSFSAKLSAPAPVSIRFDALGKSFDLQLVSNERIASGIQSEAVRAQVEVYRGKLANNPQSWARIVVFEGMPRGMIWDGVEMYAVEAPGDSALAIDSPVMYRMSDAFVIAGTMSCGSNYLSGSAAEILKDIGTATKVAVARAAGAISEITMSAIGDFEFTDARGGDNAAIAAISTRLNNIDGYFSEQVGVQINVQPPIETHSDPADPFTDTIESEVLLDQLSEYRLQTASHNSRGLTHLWTGKDLATTTVGIAWRGTLCEDYFGTGLSEGNGGALIDSLVAAHEIGHNFGAQHDGEAGTSCESETGRFIMSPSINGSSLFSDCSIEIMQAEAAAASCVTALPTVDVSVMPATLVSDVLLGAATDFEYEIASNGLIDAANVSVSFAIPNVLTLNTATTSAGTCTNGAGVVVCDFGNLPGLSRETITLSVTPNALGAGTLTATVATSDTDERPGNNRHDTDFVVQIAVDLVAAVPTSAAVFLGESTAVTVSLQNTSSVDATNVFASIALENGLEAVAATWSIGSCTVSAQQIDCQANSFAAMSASTLNITVNAVLRGRRIVTVTLSSTEADAAPADNTSVGVVVVVVQEEKKKDSGGATSPLLLLLGSIAVLFARRRQITSAAYSDNR